MSRPRCKDKHLPLCVYRQHGAYWYVQAGKWTRLGVELSDDFYRYASIVSTAKGSMPDVIDRALEAKRDTVKSNTCHQYRVAARRLREAFAEFTPGQVRRKHVKQRMEHLSGTLNMTHRIRTVLMLVMDSAFDMALPMRPRFT